MEKSVIITYNLKLREKVRDKFKEIVHHRGTTMQTVLSAFAESYIESPDKFRVKMEVETNDEGVLDSRRDENPGG